MLDTYLQNLNTIIRKFNSLPTLKSIVDVHGKLLEKREANRKKIGEMYEWMKKEYEAIVKEIEEV